MAEFTPIETQEAFDELVKGRISRLTAKHEKEIAERFGDYDQLKAAAEAAAAKESDYEARLKEAHDALEKANAEAKGHASAIAERDAKIAELTLASNRVQIAAAAGIPLEFADRLTGKTVEELQADAEKLVAMFHRGAPGRKFEQPTGEDFYRALVRGVRKN